MARSKKKGQKKRALTPANIAKSQQDNNQLRVQRIEQRLVSHSGPLPPPEVMAKYDELLPGSAERIFAMAENQATHRQGLEKSVILSGRIQEKASGLGSSWVYWP